jgi:hypothetical protein
MLAHLGPNLQFPYKHSDRIVSPCYSEPFIPSRTTMTVNNAISTYLGEVFAHSLGGSAEVMAEGASIAGLTCTLSEELAWDVRCICREKRWR